MSAADLIDAITRALEQERFDLRDRHLNLVRELENNFSGTFSASAHDGLRHDAILEAKNETSSVGRAIMEAAENQTLPENEREKLEEAPSASNLVKKTRRASLLNKLATNGQRGSIQHTQADTTLKKIVLHPWFELTISAFIVISTLFMVLELQYRGNVEGYELGYPKYTNPNAWGPGAIEVFTWVGWICGSVFTFELLIKLLALGVRAMTKDPYTYVDLFIVACWILEYPGRESFAFNALPLRAIRIARLMRITRLFRLIQRVIAVDQLILLVESIKGAGNIFFWSTMLLFLIMVACSIFFQQLLAVYISDGNQPLDKRMKMFEYFGTFTRSMISMTELALGNYIPILRFLKEHVYEWTSVVILAYRLCIGFAVMSVIRGIFMREVFQIASSNDRVMVMNKRRIASKQDQNMQRLFAVVDSSGDGMVTLSEFLEVLEDDANGIKTWLSAQEFAISDLEWLFLEVTKNRETPRDDAREEGITSQEFISGMSKLKGTARAVELMKLAHRQEEFARQQAESRALLSRMASRIEKMARHDNDDGFRLTSKGTLCDETEGLPERTKTGKTQALDCGTVLGRRAHEFCFEKEGIVANHEGTSEGARPPKPQRKKASKKRTAPQLGKEYAGQPEPMDKREQTNEVAPTVRLNSPWLQ